MWRDFHDKRCTMKIAKWSLQEDCIPATNQRTAVHIMIIILREKKREIGRRD